MHIDSMVDLDEAPLRNVEDKWKVNTSFDTDLLNRVYKVTVNLHRDLLR